jgi:hypothetical protein
MTKAAGAPRERRHDLLYSDNAMMTIHSSGFMPLRSIPAISIFTLLTTTSSDCRTCLTMENNVFCCSNLQPYRPKTLDHEPKFTDFISWAKWASLGTVAAGKSSDKLGVCSILLCSGCQATGVTVYRAFVGNLPSK